ncbi:ABC transporter permease [Chondrinema litorale]|uniref:ABC transporter permease n=1 Tax=Chondrinema litorale TaxID=2994555 RepID=UPI002543D22D|nr:ABC transporter permease [Chondrinema litorale]UZR97650.1 permease prefix domain 2-containing transporter [Chondrinema litorale]
MNRPPKWIDKLLEYLCPSDLLEEVMGDLHERYTLRAKRVGENKANKQYLREVLAYMRPIIFSKTSSEYNKSIFSNMLKNYFLIAFRNLTKHKVFTYINIAGLTLGITCALFILLIVKFELSFDTYHTKADRIYRVITGSRPDDPVSYHAGTPHGLAPVLKEEFPEVEKVAVIKRINSQKRQFKIDNDIVKLSNSYFVSPEFFEVFDYEWINGNPEKSLSEQGQMVITESIAKTYFDGDALGKRVRMNNEYDLVVSGIIKDLPKNTDNPFEVAVSHATYAASDDYDKEYSPSHSSGYHTYVLLKENADNKALDAKFPAMIEKYNGKEVAEKFLAHVLQPMSDVHFNEIWSNGNFKNQITSKKSIWTIALIGLFILLIACINFINLTTAQAGKRAKEVGVRKVMGSSRKQLIFQFMGESFTLTLVATILSVVLTSILLPYLKTLLEINLDEQLLFSNDVILGLVIQCVVVSLLAGFYPAMVLSGYKPVSIFKANQSSNNFGALWLRKGLVVFQFTITQVLIIATIVVVSQQNYFRTTSLGFNKQAVLIVDLPEYDESKADFIRNKLSQYPQIEGVSFSLNAPSAASNKWFNLFWHESDPDKGRQVEMKPVDDKYLEVYDIPLLAGAPLRDGDSSILVNEAFVKEIGFTKPEEAIGEMVTCGGKNIFIKGVVKDFHTLSLHEKIYPVMLVDLKHQFQLASFKIDLKNAGEAISAIEDQWQELFPEYYMNYRFVDDDIETWYDQERRTSRFLTLFAGIAIFIGCLGLYGLISFITGQRTKEVGIRKVLGASAQHIIYLFSKEFALLIALAFIIAVPIAYYFMNNWLNTFTYKIDMSWWIFAIAAISGVLIAGFTIGFKSIKTALTNPIDSLRNE